MKLLALSVLCVAALQPAQRQYHNTTRDPYGGCTRAYGPLTVLQQPLFVYGSARPAYATYEFVHIWESVSRELRLRWLDDWTKRVHGFPAYHTASMDNWSMADFGQRDIQGLDKGAGWIGRAGIALMIDSSVQADETFETYIEFQTLQLIAAGTNAYVDARDACDNSHVQGSGNHEGMEPQLVTVKVLAPSTTQQTYTLDVLTDFHGSFRGPTHSVALAAYVDSYLEEAMESGRVVIAAGNTFVTPALEADVDGSLLSTRFLDLLEAPAVALSVDDLNRIGYDGMMNFTDAATGWKPRYLVSNLFDRRCHLDHAFELFRVAEVPADDASSSDVLSVAVFNMFSETDFQRLDGDLRVWIYMVPDYLRAIHEKCLNVIARQEAQTCVLVTSYGAELDAEGNLQADSELAKLVANEVDTSLFTAIISYGTDATFLLEKANGYAVVAQGQQRGGVVRLTFSQDANVATHVSATARLTTVTQAIARREVAKKSSDPTHAAAGGVADVAAIDRRQKNRQLSSLWTQTKLYAVQEALAIKDYTAGELNGDFTLPSRCETESNYVTLAADAILSHAKSVDPSISLALVDCEAFGSGLGSTGASGQLQITWLQVHGTIKHDDTLRVLDVTGSQLLAALSRQFGSNERISTYRNAWSVSENASYRFSKDFETGLWRVSDLIIDGEYVRSDQTYRVAATAQIATHINHASHGGLDLPAPREALSLTTLSEAIAIYIKSREQISANKDIRIPRGVDLDSATRKIQLLDVSLSTTPQYSTDSFDISFIFTSSESIKGPFIFYAHPSGRELSFINSIDKDSTFSVSFRTQLAQVEDNTVRVWVTEAAWIDQSFSEATSFAAKLPPAKDTAHAAFGLGAIATLTVLSYSVH